MNRELTMLNQRAKKPDPSVIRAIRMPAAKGKIPQMFIRVLNRPVRLITHLGRFRISRRQIDDVWAYPANKEPAASETLFGIKCKPSKDTRQLQIRIGESFAYQQSRRCPAERFRTTSRRSM
jgi:hypothetical protein